MPQWDCQKNQLLSPGEQIIQRRYHQPERRRSCGCLFARSVEGKGCWWGECVGTVCFFEEYDTDYQLFFDGQTVHAFEAQCSQLRITASDSFRKNIQKRRSHHRSGKRTRANQITNGPIWRRQGLFDSHWHDSDKRVSWLMCVIRYGTTVYYDCVSLSNFMGFDNFDRFWW